VRDLDGETHRVERVDDDAPAWGLDGVLVLQLATDHGDGGTLYHTVSEWTWRELVRRARAVLPIDRPRGPAPATADARAFGVEIECAVADRPALAAALRARGLAVDDPYDVDAPRARGAGCWRLARDPTIRVPAGWRDVELRSPRLCGAAGHAALAAACAALAAAGAAADESCGLHVHYEAHDFGVAEARALLRGYRRDLPRIEAGLAPHRRVADPRAYSRLWDAADEEGWATARTILDLAAPRGHRPVVHVGAYLQHGTIEFRQHEGTLDAGRISAWVRAGQQRLAAARDEARDEAARDGARAA